MKKTKPNISLLNLAEIRTGGVFLAALKGINEIKNRKKTKQALSAPFCGSSFVYDPVLSVIICTCDRHRLAIDAINSILSEPFSNREIILVNNSAHSIDRAMLPCGVKYIHEKEPGLSNARNSGAKAAKGEYLLYIDDDALACKNLLSVVFSAFLKHPDTAIIGGQIYLDIPPSAHDIVLDGKESLWSAYTVPYKRFREVKEHYEFPYGACFAIRHSALDKIGGFPHSYGRCGNNYAGGEETAVCFSAKKLGFKIGIEPNAAVLHRVSPERFSHEHIQKTVREGILTTYRLMLDGYADYLWTVEYVANRLAIAKKELERLDGLAAFYKRFECDAFAELYNIMQQNSLKKD